MIMKLILHMRGIETFKQYISKLTILLKYFNQYS